MNVHYWSSRVSRKYAFVIVALLSVLSVAPAWSAPILTADGVTGGFTLSMFANNFPITSSPCCGPLGIAFPTSGGVMVSDYGGNVRVFPTDTDGQNAASIPVAQNYGSGNGVGLAVAGGIVYMAEQSASQVVQLNNNGTLNQVIIGNPPGISFATGIVANPANGHLFVSDCCGGSGIWDVDPIAKTKTLFKGGSFDGLTITPDGSTLYAEQGGVIYGFKTSDGTQVFASPFINGADGTALGFGSLGGLIFVNTNFGDLFEVNLGTLGVTNLVTGGTRGDFVTADPNGSLLFTQTSDIWRLTPPSGGCIGNQCTVTVPEPATLALLGVAFAGMGWARRRKLTS